MRKNDNNKDNVKLKKKSPFCLKKISCKVTYRVCINCAEFNLEGCTCITFGGGGEWECCEYMYN